MIVRCLFAKAVVRFSGVLALGLVLVVGPTRGALGETAATSRGKPDAAVTAVPAATGPTISAAPTVETAPVPAATAAPGATGSAIELAILGDSLSTGAATHPALAFDGNLLWKVFDGTLSVAPRVADLPDAVRMRVRQDPPLPPRRLWPTAREFFGGPDWVYRNALQALSRAYLDTEEYSWGYQLGIRLGLSPNEIAIAGEDGARMDAMTRHLDRLLDAGGGVWPHRIMILYTGNDLCGASLDAVTSSDDFAAALSTGLDYIQRNGRSAAGGTDVYVLSYLGVLQLLDTPSILDHKVRAFGGEMTCRELRQNGYRPEGGAPPPSAPDGVPVDAWYFSMLMPPNPAAFCPTLFAVQAPDRDKTVAALANRIRAYRDAEEQVVKAADDKVQDAKGLRFHLLRSTAALRFTGDDIAADCFHLSVKGQAKVAAAVLQDLGQVAVK